MSPDGPGRRHLYTFPVDNIPSYGALGTRPAYSPDGRLVVFDSGDSLAIMRDDGTDFRVLPPLSDSVETPTWSPNGRRIVFSGLHPCPLYCGTLFTVRPDGTELRQVLDYHAQWPAWSVNGRIAFLNNDDQYRMMIGPRDGLYSVSSDGSKQRRLFGSFIALGNEPDWSPDGRRLAFRARGRIFTMNADGSRRRPITGSGRRYGNPAWSPNGRYIAVIGANEDEHGLFIMRPNGGGLRKVLDASRTTSSDGQLLEWEVLGAPSWQPLRH